MGTARTCLIPGRERVRLVHGLDRLCRNEQAWNRGTVGDG